VVGLEIHAQIKSGVKLFSPAPSEFDRPPNSSVQLFDAAFPGTLPVLNYACVEAALRTALALNCCINQVSYFDRKHYFYCDLPAGYQITQHRLPLATQGYIKIADRDGNEEKLIRIKQLHLEQDSGRSIVDEKRGITFVDLNRSGIGLMEIVTEPDMKSGEEVATVVRELRKILQLLDTCDGDMASGSLRVDANVSLHGDGLSGTQTEIKNVSGIPNLRKAVDYEITRHMKEDGDLESETRSFDVKTGITVAARQKHFQRQDYRFIPEHDLPPLVWSNYVSLDLFTLRSSLPALPTDIRRRLAEKYFISSKESSSLVEQNAVEYFEAAAKHCMDSRKLAGWVVRNLAGILNNKMASFSDSPVSPLQMSSIVNLVAEDRISVRTAQKIFYCMADGDQRLASEIMQENNWLQITDVNHIKGICETVIAQHDTLVSSYRYGKLELLNFFIGQAQRLCGGRIHPQTLETVMASKLNTTADEWKDA
jgi:aspartyl-tRNA(Asn)/glutamyl-tRNA(Gln) amidotransferase subunit B